MTRYVHGILIATSLLAAASAHGQSADTSDWVCEFCPFRTGHEGDYEVGASNASDDSAYFGNATGYDEKGTYANVDGQGNFAGEDHRLRWSVEDLALDSRVAELEGRQPGSFDYNVSWREIPRRQFITTDTVFRKVGPDTLVLPTGWVRAPLTSGFTALDSSLERRDIASDRRIFDIGGSFLPTSRWKLSADYRRQTQEGIKIVGGPYYTQSSLLPAPFEYTTDEVELGVRYAFNGGFVDLAWYLSEFENKNTALNWENPFTSAPGSEVGALAQAPDNQFSQLSLSGTYALDGYRTVIGFSASTGQMEQNDILLPYTTNSGLSTDPLPRANAGVDVDTGNIAVSLTSKVTDKGRVRFSYRYDERDNKTPQEVFNRVVAETFLSGDLEENIPYSFERSLLNLSADYDLFDTLRISGGYDRHEIEREFQEVREQTEDSGWGRARWRPNDTLNFDFKAGAAKRDIDEYNETVAVAVGQNPLMRKYNLAYRYRRFGELIVDTTPPGSPVSLTLTGLFADDKYSRSELGVTDANDTRVTADLSWTINPNALVYLNGGYESIQSTQLGSESFDIADWRATNDDTFINWGAGFSIRQIGGKVDLQLDYTRADGSSEIDLASVRNGENAFPKLESTLDHLRLVLGWQTSDQLRVDAGIRYQRFKAEDWALEGVAPDTIPTVLSLGALPYDDEQLIVSLGFSYRVGASSGSSSP